MGSVSGKHVSGKDPTSQTTSTYRRQAYHAGSWYGDHPKALHQNLERYLQKAEESPNNKVRKNACNDKSTALRALIVPHAGYRYSGPTAAYSYYALQEALNQKQTPIENILVLHPAHHVYLSGCAVSGATVLETPLGNLEVDDELRQEILALSSSFTVMTASTDEEEHSGEMQYPFLAKVLLSSPGQHQHQHQQHQKSKKENIKVLPIMCGALSTSQEEKFGQLLSEIIARPNVLCVISSDFCHWGSRFRYQPTATPGNMPIHEFIRELDQEGMDLIALQKPGAFAEYLKRTKNTICGRHAIAVWLQAIAAANYKNSGSNDQAVQVDFVKYAQSGAVTSMDDSSVSYAAAVVTADL